MIVDYLELFVSEENTEKLYVTILKTKEELVLIDAGYPNMVDIIGKQLEKKGYFLNDITQIWITHHDHDHVGSLAEFKTRFPNIIIKSSEIEKPYVQGDIASLRLSQAIELQKTLPEKEQQGGFDFQNYLKTIAPVKIDETILTGQAMLNNQVVALDTTGHTKGHISFYIRSSETLIAGDMLVIKNGTLSIPFPQFAYDIKCAKKSVLAISDLPICSIFCYHGGVLNERNEIIKNQLINACTF